MPDEPLRVEVEAEEEPEERYQPDERLESDFKRQKAYNTPKGLVHEGVLSENMAMVLSRKFGENFPAKMRAGLITERQLRDIGYIGDSKIEKLIEIYPAIPRAPKVAKQRGRPRASILGPARDPYSRANQKKAALRTSTAIVRNDQGTLVRSQQKSRLSEALGRFQEGFRETVGRPFKLFNEARNTEARRYVREAKKVAATKRAAKFLEHEQRARNGFMASFWEFMFHGGNAVRTTLFLALIVAVPLLIPFGIFQYAGWIVFGLAAFMINGAYLVGLTAVNVAVSGAMNAVNILGFSLAQVLQGFLDQISILLPTSAGGGGILPGYNPVDPSSFGSFAQVLDPNLLFPDCVNSNTIGSVLFTLLAGAFVSLSGWISTNGSFALGLTIAIFLGIPAYFISRGTSIGIFVLGGLIALIPTQGVTVPMGWTIALSVLGLIGGILAIRALAKDAGPIGIVLTMATIATGAILVYAFTQLYQSVAGDSAAFAQAITGPLQLGTQPLANSVAGGAMNVAHAFTFLGGLITTGWAHALDPSNFTAVRSWISMGNAKTLAEAAQAKCGGA